MHLELKKTVDSAKDRITKLLKKTSREDLLSFVQKNKYFFVFFLLSFVIFSLWLYAYQPAAMSFDSRYEWDQVVKGYYDNVLPFVHTFIFVLLSKIWNTPSVLTLFQILISSLLLSLYLNYFIRKGINKIIVWIIFFVFIIQPSIGIYNVTIWKDVLYAQAISLIGFIWIIHSQKPTSTILSSWWELVLFGLLLVITSSLRHNGIIYLVFIPGLYYLLKQIDIKRLAKLLLVIFFLYLTINLGLFTLLHVKSELNVAEEQPKIHMLGLILKMGYEPTPEERDVITQLADIDTFKEGYYCHSSNWIFFKKLEYRKLYDDEFAKNFNAKVNPILIENIPILFADRVCMFSHMIGLSTDYALTYYSSIQKDVDFIDPGVQRDSSLKSKFDEYLDWSDHYPQKIALWAHVSSILILALFVIKSIYDHNKLTFGWISILLINVPLIFIITHSSNFRYLYMIQFSYLFIFGIYLLKPWRKSKSRKK